MGRRNLLGVDRELAAVLGFLRRKGPRVRTERDLPHNVTPEVLAIAEEEFSEETHWRWAPRFSFESYPWQSATACEEVAGPVDFDELRRGARTLDVGGWMRAATPRKLADLASRGFSCVSNEEMADLLARDPSLLDDKLQMKGRVYTVMHAEVTAAEALGFGDTLAWLRTEGSGEASRVILAMT
jgi:hypothetical protein